MKYILLLVFSLTIVPAPGAAELNRDRKQELRHMLYHDCGSCHGMTLKGGLGPALTLDVLSDRTAEALIAAVEYGRPGTPMPPFKGILSGEEIRWIVDYLLQETAQ